MRHLVETPRAGKQRLGNSNLNHSHVGNDLRPGPQRVYAQLHGSRTEVDLTGNLRVSLGPDYSTHDVTLGGRQGQALGQRGLHQPQALPVYFLGEKRVFFH